MLGHLKHTLYSCFLFWLRPSPGPSPLEGADSRDRQPDRVSATTTLPEVCCCHQDYTRLDKKHTYREGSGSLDDKVW